MKYQLLQIKDDNNTGENNNYHYINYNDINLKKTFLNENE